MATDAQQFQWDLAYLRRNQIPLDLNGREVRELQYGSHSLTDDSVAQLSSALEGNSTFKGLVSLNSNHLSDLAVLSLCHAFARSFEISGLDLAYNNLTDKSGVYLSKVLPLSRRLRELTLTGCSLEVVGLQRLLEILPQTKVETLDVGVVSSKGLGLLGKYVNKVATLRHLTFQEGDLWSEEAKSSLLTVLRQNHTLLSLEAACEDDVPHFSFLGEIHALCERNRRLFLSLHASKYRQELLDPKRFSEETVGRIEGSLQHLPVRAYMDNTFGTLLNDGLYELFKERQRDETHNTAGKNVQWLVRYLLEHATEAAS